MSWVTITSDDIKTRLSGPEVTSVKTYDLASGQSDPHDEAIALSLAEVRGYIPRSCKDPDTTLIPPELKDTAIIVAIEKLAGRLSGGGCIMTEERIRAHEIAIQRLRDTARGQFHFTSGIAAESAGISADSDDIQGGNSAMCYGGEAKLEF